MKKYKVWLNEFSHKTEDGSRKTINRTIICSCTDQGSAMIILKLLKENTYKTLLESNDGSKANETMYTLTVQQ